MRLSRVLAALVLPLLLGCHSMVSLPRDEASDLLHALRDSYMAKDVPAYLEQLDAEFTAIDFAATPMETRNDERLIVRQGRGKIDRETFGRLLRDELSQFQSIERAKSHLIGMWPVEGREDEWEVEGLFRVWGITRSGKRHYEDQVLRLRVVRVGEKLRARSLHITERTVVVGSGVEFKECAKAVGLAVEHHPHTPYDEQNKRLVPGLYSGSGTSAGDIDGDGWLDVLVGDGVRCRLFKNLAGKRFEDITEGSGLEGIDKVTGAYLVDVDDDGKLDIFLTRVKSTPRLLLNQGEGRFREAPEWLKGLPIGNYESAAFGDLDGDGDLDVYLTRYGDFDTVSFAFPLYEATDGEVDVVLRNEGDKFTRLEVSVFDVKGWGRAVCMTDYDDDGDLDIYVVNDFGSNHLYRNEGSWTFTDVTEMAGARDQGFGMSAASGDYDGDGDLDLFVTNVHSSSGWVFDDPEFPLPTIADLFLRDHVRAEVVKVLRGNTLLQNQGDGTFVQVAKESGVERGEWAWGGTFFDYDNDGDLDIYCPNGYVTGVNAEDT